MSAGNTSQFIGSTATGGGLQRVTDIVGKGPIITGILESGDLREGIYDILVILNFPFLFGLSKFTFVGTTAFIFDAMGHLDNTRIGLYKAHSLDVLPALLPVPREGNLFPECVGDWELDNIGTAFQAKYYTIRLNVPAGVTGDFLVLLK